MQTKSLVLSSVVAAACMSFMAATAAQAADQKQDAKDTSVRVSHPFFTSMAHERVILVEVTGSRIPQRVVISGEQVNSSSPLHVVNSNEAARTGASSVYGMLSQDPSVRLGGGRR